ncbi:MAG: hypothetical protein VB009_03595 [Erysipelotrichaceae bacterium]|nr:hypothetical protein [Erysipelotrichaceae bacterium]
MLRWFIDLFFDVEEEIIEEHKEEEVEKPVAEELSKKVLIEPEKLNVKSEVKKEDSISDQDISIKKEEKKRIFIDDVKATKNEQPSIEYVGYEDKDYQFTPIISPMFGVDEKHQPKKTEYKPSVNAIKNTSAIGTIISPIYGLDIQSKISKVSVIDDQQIPIVNIDLAEMIKDDFDEGISEIDDQAITENLYNKDQEIINEVIETISNSEIKTKTIPEEEVSSKTKDETAQQDKKSVLHKSDLSEEEKFEVDNQPSLFDF